MHATKGLSLASLALSILERFASAWHWAWFTLVVARLMDTSRALTREEVWGMVHHLYESEARLARAIYKTARRLAGLPRMHLPLETFYLPRLKSPRHLKGRWVRHQYALQHSRRLALRMAKRWREEAEQLQRDPLSDLRDRGTCLPSAQRGGNGARHLRRVTEAAAPNAATLRVLEPP